MCLIKTEGTGFVLNHEMRKNRNENDSEVISLLAKNKNNFEDDVKTTKNMTKVVLP